MLLPNYHSDVYVADKSGGELAWTVVLKAYASKTLPCPWVLTGSIFFDSMNENNMVLEFLPQKAVFVREKVSCGRLKQLWNPLKKHFLTKRARFGEKIFFFLPQKRISCEEKIVDKIREQAISYL